jgi:hypothetical protein
MYVNDIVDPSERRWRRMCIRKGIQYVLIRLVDDPR